MIIIVTIIIIFFIITNINIYIIIINITLQFSLQYIKILIYSTSDGW